MRETKPGAKSATPGAFDHMTDRFPVSRTLCFRLLPVGRTEETVKRFYLDADITLSKDRALVKAAADRIHKSFIDSVLEGHRIKYLSDGGRDSLQEYAETAASDMDNDAKEKALAEIAGNMKKAVAKAFESVPYGDDKMLKALKGQDLLKKLLPSIPLIGGEAESVARLKRYTTFMMDYASARDRMYRADQDGHTIPNRIFDDNLPIHLENVRRFSALPYEVIEKAAPVFSIVGDLLDATCVEEMFCVSAFSGMSDQGAIDAYNTVIGGIAYENGDFTQGLNTIIKEYNDNNPKANLPRLEKLKKQILSDRETLSWLNEAITSDWQVLTSLRSLQEEFLETFPERERALLPGTAAGADTSGVWVDAKRLEAYSLGAYGDWGLAKTALTEAIRTANPKGPRMSDKGYEEKIEKAFRHRKAFSCAEIAEAVTALTGTDASGNAFGRYVVREISDRLATAETLFKEMDAYLAAMGGDEKLGQEPGQGKDNARAYIKRWLDELNAASRAASVFCAPEGEGKEDSPFAEAVTEPWKEFRTILRKTHDKVRNYLTKKPFKTDKVQLMFGNPTLLAGWDLNKEPDNRGVILRKGEDIFLAILPAHSKKLLTERFEPPYEGPVMRKLEVKFFKDAKQTLPGICFGKKPIPRAVKPYDAPADVLELYSRTKRGEVAVKDYAREESAMMIDFYKSAISKNRDWDILGLKFKPTQEYARLADFFDDVNAQGYKMYYRDIPERVVTEAVERGDLFLFKVTCQDMSEAHHGKDGNHKVLLLEALSERNLADNRIRIAGGAAVYFRQASLEKRVTHPRGVAIKNKNPEAASPTRTLHYDLYKDKRYMEDRFALHLPVSISPNADRNGERYINETVREVIRRNPGMYVLGINRGERSLVSIAVTAPDGTIAEQRNLNVLDGFDYRRKLTEREHERTDDRKNWNAVRDIANLKKGYLSRVVGEIVRLQKKYGCVIALEKLDMEFKNSRKQFERNVYEQFERDLVGRFGLLMDKDDPDRTRTALQLTAPGQNAEERTKYPQNGIIFFVAPSWVTKTDPYTGFANRLNTHYSSVSESERWMSLFDSFRFDPAKGRFVLSFRYGVAAPGKDAGDPDRVWEVETKGTRHVDKWEGTDGAGTKDADISLTGETARLLDSHGIAYKSGEDIIPQTAGKDEAFWKGLMSLVRLTLQNTDWNPGTREFRIVSCTADEKGRFYDSRTAREDMPKDADVLAAWNIARKAHMMLRKVREYDPADPPRNEKGKALPLHITFPDSEWFAEVQD